MWKYVNKSSLKDPNIAEDAFQNDFKINKYWFFENYKS